MDQARISERNLGRASVRPAFEKNVMCDECDDSSALHVAYFNKRDGKRWRPPPKAANAPLAVDRQAVAPVPVTAREVRRYTCD